MDVRDEIARQLDKLPAAMQEQVLRFAASLSATTPVGESGADLIRFAGTLDTESARQMREAIEEGCERIEPADW
jgi:hypothetical protein